MWCLQEIFNFLMYALIQNSVLNVVISFELAVEAVCYCFRFRSRRKNKSTAYSLYGPLHIGRFRRAGREDVFEATKDIDQKLCVIKLCEYVFSIPAHKKKNIVTKFVRCMHGENSPTGR
ncbi:hypothetical protein AVEN_68978-1 [Araneus ventricosus]|uniref:Uncharacterized protein n=1 Tax=Araneus ventricosus TaxID=182803 RepID=A0A4Y2NEW8_ARAVE|nr:hypothetical protein AVEN_163811-1 [Araneus ventricosus]GBN96834.1 hypothetical protein AVEN_68978-1 [Araneus ventricosus]